MDVSYKTANMKNRDVISISFSVVALISLVTFLVAFFVLNKYVPTKLDNLLFSELHPLAIFGGAVFASLLLSGFVLVAYTFKTIGIFKNLSTKNLNEYQSVFRKSLKTAVTLPFVVLIGWLGLVFFTG